MEILEFKFQRKKLNLTINGELFVLRIPSIDELKAHSAELTKSEDVTVVDLVRDWIVSLLINPAQGDKLTKALLAEFDIDSLFDLYAVFKGQKKS